MLVDRLISTTMYPRPSTYNVQRPPISAIWSLTDLHRRQLLPRDDTLPHARPKDPPSRDHVVMDTDNMEFSHLTDQDRMTVSLDPTHPDGRGGMKRKLKKAKDAQTQ
jgi:hypothetical protein